MPERKYKNRYTFSGSKEHVIKRTRGLAKIFTELDVDELTVRVDVDGIKRVERRQILTSRKLAVIGLAISVTGILLAFILRVI